MNTPKRFIILRDVENDATIKISMIEKPKQVWTLLNEALFNDMGLKHLITSFMEDRTHDWDWQNEVFRFYGHSGSRGQKHDLVIVYEV